MLAFRAVIAVLVRHHCICSDSWDLCQNERYSVVTHARVPDSSLTPSMQRWDRPHVHHACQIGEYSVDAVGPSGVPNAMLCNVRVVFKVFLHLSLVEVPCEYHQWVIVPAFSLRDSSSKELH